MDPRVWRRLKQNKTAIASGALVACFIVAAVLAPWILPYDPNRQDRAQANEGPTLAHPLGRDMLGRDVLSRLLLGARVSLKVGFLVVGITSVLGVLIGMGAGYAGGWIDEIVMRTIDILLAFPGLLLAIAMTAVLGPDLDHVILALCIMGWTGFARLARGQTLVLRELPFVEAARAAGAGPGRILLRHLLPNLLAPVIVQATLGIAGAIAAEASLSFLGLGVQPPEPSWGSMLNEGTSCLREAPHIALFSGLAISAVLLGLNFFGDGLRDALDAKGLVRD